MTGTFTQSMQCSNLRKSLTDQYWSVNWIRLRRKYSNLINSLDHPVGNYRTQTFLRSFYFVERFPKTVVTRCCSVWVCINKETVEQQPLDWHLTVANKHSLTFVLISLIWDFEWNRKLMLEEENVLMAVFELAGYCMTFVKNCQIIFTMVISSISCSILYPTWSFPSIHPSTHL